MATLGARQHQVKRGCDRSAPTAAHFLIGWRRASDGISAQAGHGGQKIRAGHHSHVETGDRQHVGEARNVEGIAHRRRNGAAFAGDQRRSDRAAIARQQGVDAAVDRLAHAVDQGGGAQPQPRRLRGRFAGDLAEHIAGGADLLEIHGAREIVAPGPQGLQRRRQMRLECNEARNRRRGAFAHRDAHPLGLHAHARCVDRHDAHHDAVALGALLAHLDEAGDLRAPGRIGQHRVGNAQGLQRGSDETGGRGRKRKRERKAERTAAGERRDRHAGQRSGHRRPPSRLSLSGEIADDAQAISDRQPGQQAARRDFRYYPLRQQPPQPVGGKAEPIRQQQSRRAGARRRFPRPRLSPAIGFPRCLPWPLSPGMGYAGHATAARGCD